MKEKLFKYKKKDEVKSYNILVLNESDLHFSGISYEGMTEKDVKELKQIQLEYEDKLKPFMEHFRKFKKEMVLEEHIN